MTTIAQDRKGRWELAIKRSLGNVWHKEAIAERAHCDHRIRLSELQEGPPRGDGYICKRCVALSTITTPEPTNEAR